MGKTTLVRFIIDALNLDEDDVVYATYTGKAAQVLSKKGNKNVATLHKLLYESFPRPDGTFYRKPRLEIDYRLVVVDECSMAPKTLVNLLLSHDDIHVIFLGDPFQIPPLPKGDEDENNHLLDHPDIFLDEIMRQEAESEIIQLSMAIRNYQPIKYFKGNDVQVLDKRELSTGMMQWADQIIVATNKTRQKINNQMRQLCGFHTMTPQEGDKVICARNYWNIYSDQDNALINGTIGYLHNKFETYHYIPRYLGGGLINVTMADLQMNDNETFSNLAMDRHMIETGEKCISKQLEYKLMRNPKTSGIPPLEFNYGYAITTHRAQGSQWDKILIIEERFPFSKEEHARHLYTSVTRSCKKVVLLR